MIFVARSRYLQNLPPRNVEEYELFYPRHEQLTIIVNKVSPVFVVLQEIVYKLNEKGQEEVSDKLIAQFNRFEQNGEMKTLNDLATLVCNIVYLFDENREIIIPNNVFDENRATI